MSPTLAFRFYDTEFEQNIESMATSYATSTDIKRSTAIITPTSTSTSARIGGATTSTNVATVSNPNKFKKCTCCPYGYHIDLDFIRYCEELAKNGKKPTNKQLERRNKRRQRKSLEVMLGYNDQWLFDIGKHPTIVTKPQPATGFQTVYEVKIWERFNGMGENVDNNESLMNLL